MIQFLRATNGASCKPVEVKLLVLGGAGTNKTLDSDLTLARQGKSLSF